MRLTVTVPDDLARQARQLAADTDRSVSSVVAQAIAHHVAAERRRHAARRIDALIGSVPDTTHATRALREMRGSSDRDLS